jgi:ribonuclease/clavin/mitogillin
LVVVLGFDDFEFPLDRPANFYLVKTGDSSIFVDTGTSKTLSNPRAPKAEYAIVTHYHLDHAGGLIALARKPEKPVVCASEETARFLYDIRLIEERMLTISKAIGVLSASQARLLGEPMRAKYEEISSAVQELGLEAPEKCLEPFKGDYIYCPGHSADHICVLIEGHAFVGDNIVGGPNVTLSDVYSYFESMARLQSRADYNIVHPGHGPKELGRGEVSELVIATMRSKRRRLARVIAAIASGQGDWVGLDEVYKYVYKRLDNPLIAWVAARSLLGYLTSLEADGVVEVDRSTSPWRVRLREG